MTFNKQLPWIWVSFVVPFSRDKFRKIVEEKGWKIEKSDDGDILVAGNVKADLGGIRDVKIEMWGYPVIEVNGEKQLLSPAKLREILTQYIDIIIEIYATWFKKIKKEVI